MCQVEMIKNRLKREGKSASVSEVNGPKIKECDKGGSGSRRGVQNGIFSWIVGDGGDRGLGRIWGSGNGLGHVWVYFLRSYLNLGLPLNSLTLKIIFCPSPPVARPTLATVHYLRSIDLSCTGTLLSFLIYF